jgi:hypothetical protein
MSVSWAQLVHISYLITGLQLSQAGLHQLDKIGPCRQARTGKPRERALGLYNLVGIEVCQKVSPSYITYGDHSVIFISSSGHLHRNCRSQAGRSPLLGFMISSA